MGYPKVHSNTAVGDSFPGIVHHLDLDADTPPVGFPADGGSQNFALKAQGFAQFDRANLGQRDSFSCDPQLVTGDIKGVATPPFLLEFRIRCAALKEVDEGVLEISKWTCSRIPVDLIRPGQLRPAQRIERLLETMACGLLAVLVAVLPFH